MIRQQWRIATNDSNVSIYSGGNCMRRGTVSSIQYTCQFHTAGCWTPFFILPDGAKLQEKVSPLTDFSVFGVYHSVFGRKTSDCHFSQQSNNRQSLRNCVIAHAVRFCA
jgi:hypothetical protein